MTISVPTKMIKVIDELVSEGDYHNRSDFIREAIRAHLNTWYSSKWGEQKES